MSINCHFTKQITLTGKCDDKETWACMEIEQIGGCNQNNEKWEKAKNVCKRTCNICSSDDDMTGKLHCDTII